MISKKRENRFFQAVKDKIDFLLKYWRNQIFPRKNAENSISPEIKDKIDYPIKILKQDFSRKNWRK